MFRLFNVRYHDTDDFHVEVINTHSIERISWEDEKKEGVFYFKDYVMYVKGYNNWNELASAFLFVGQ